MRSCGAIKRPGVGIKSRLMGLGAVSFLVSCSAKHAQPEVSSAESNFTGTQTLAVMIPTGTALHGVALAATDSLDVDPQASVSLAAGGFGAVANTGTGPTTIGSGANVGDVFSQSSVRLFPGGHINGNVTTAGTLSKGIQATVTGTVQEHATLTPFKPIRGT